MTYLVTSQFTIGDITALTLDKNYQFGRFNKMICEGKEYDYDLNSCKDVVVVKSTENFVGKQVVFAQI